MKIDTSKIDGYESMSAEEKLNAVLGVDIPDVEDIKSELQKNKDLVSQYSSQIADYKKKEKAKLSDDERIKAENDELIKDLQKKNEELESMIKTTSYVASFMKQGYDEELANESAKALLAGDTEKLFANIEKFNDQLRKKIEADVIKATPRPNDKGKLGNTPMTKEEFQKLSAKERVEWSQKNPEAYSNLYKGE